MRVEFRKLAGTRVHERARVSAEVIDHLQRYLSVEELLGLDSGARRTPEFRKSFPRS